MMMPVRQQMICIVAPAWPGGAYLPKGVRKSLDELLTDVGVVHFASIALLPAISGEQRKPSLMLELAIEEGLNPDDLLYRLAFHPGGAMWSLFGVYWSTPPSPASTRNQELLDRLVKWRSIADGCFVGARDRSVGQIMMERDLLEKTRRKARALKPQYGKDRAQFARALARWAFDDPNFEWAVAPAPRSYWRGKGAGIGAKLAIPILAVLAWLAVLWLTRPLSRLVARVDSWLFGDWNTPVQLASKAAGELSHYLLVSSLRFLLAFAVLGFAGWIFLGVLPALFKFYRRWLDSLVRELDRPTDTWSSISTYVSVWVVGLPLALAAIWSIGVFTFVHGDLFGYTLGPLVPAALGWKHLASGVAVIVVLLIIVVVCRFDWFYHPHEDDVDRAQQVHLSVEECEAELVRETAHMISLTDMRSPNWWSVWWTRFFLRLVTLLGYVFFTQGRLGEAPGIHFGHWHIIDSGRRYLFCSNYDGNFGGYLDDFINGASVGTTLFWRWTKLKPRQPAATGQPDLSEPRAFPPTRFLIFRGVKCELRFKSYARESMLPHLYRFEAYNLTVDQIMLATALRNALFGERNEVNDDQIMRAIES
jgi:hypothetical protein